LQIDDIRYEHIFVAGDVADTGDLKMAYKAGLHGPIVAKNIVSLIKGQKPAAIYTPKNGSEMMSLPLGKTAGVSYLSLMGGFTLGSWATKTLKGKGLMISAGRKMVGY
jgi:apoptosis-inducing factor 2